MLEYRKYSKTNVKPLLYVGSCLPPNLLDPAEEALSLKEFTWPVIKAEGQVNCKDIDERRILPNGDLVPVGRQRFDNQFNWVMMGVLEGLRATHVSEAINLLKTGSYVLNSSDTDNMGTVDFGREAELANIDISGTDSSWDNMCGKPLKTIEDIAQAMARHKGAAGVLDVIYSPYAWEWMEAHSEREAVKYDRAPVIAGGFDAAIHTGYDDVMFKGTTNGGTLRHWVTNTYYIDHTGTEVEVLADGEIMIVSKAAFGGQRIFRGVTSDNKEVLPAGGQFFLYDDLEREYDRKCRKFAPWIEEYHLMIPSNVNGAVVAKVVDKATAGDPCVSCEVCP